LPLHPLPSALHIHSFQVGCGAGNTVFPLLELNSGATVYACDFAPSAIELVRAQPAYAAAAAAGRLHAFVADITGEPRLCKSSLHATWMPSGCLPGCDVLFHHQARTSARIVAIFPPHLYRS
jgi:methyltransferase-like protein 6